MTDRPQPHPVDIQHSAPRVLEHFVGQRHVVEQVKVALEASWNDGGVRFPHALLSGPPGLGKSLLAKIVAAEMGCTLKEVLAQTIWGSNSLCALLIQANDKDVVLIDEADELDSEAQTMLYRIIDEGRIFVPSGRDNPHSIQLRNITYLLATNHLGSLVQPLRDRFKLILEFQHYGIDELFELLKRRVRGMNWHCDDEILTKIAAMGRGTPRIALRVLESCYRTTRSENRLEISQRHFDRTLQLEGLTGNLGLDRTEVRYLKILAEHQGAIRLQEISRRLSMPPRSIASVVEPFLSREGLIATTDAGRQLTPRGMEYLNTLSDAQEDSHGNE